MLYPHSRFYGPSGSHPLSPVHKKIDSYSIFLSFSKPAIEFLYMGVKYLWYLLTGFQKSRFPACPFPILPVSCIINIS